MFSQKPHIKYVEDTEGIHEQATQNQDMFFDILKSKLPSVDVNGARTWLKSNPVTIVYELETPQIIELPNFNPQTFEGNTTLLLNSGAVQAEASFEVTNSLGSELEVLKNKVSGLDNYVVDEKVYYPTLLNGWSSAYGTPLLVKSGKLVSMYIVIKGGILTQNTPIFKISDNKFIPKNSLFFSATCADSSYAYHNATTIVMADGTVKLDRVPYDTRLVINATWEVE